MSFYSELKRRNVVRVAIAYLVSAWVLLQVVDVVASILQFPDWLPRAILMALLIGLPIALALAWAFELTPEGFRKDSEVSPGVARAGSKRLDRFIIAGF